MKFVDTHAHIYHQDFGESTDHVERAIAAGVAQIYMPNVDLDTIDAMHDLADKYPSVCLAMMGLHPCHVKVGYRAVLDSMRGLFEQRVYHGVGEIGVDLYWDKSSADDQIDAYRVQLGWAMDLGLPVVIHSREALDITIGIAEEMQDGRLSGIFHCFNGSEQQGRRIVDLGMYMGIGGVLTYKNAGVDKVVAQLPMSSMVLETDAPYLTPVQYRKKGVLNEPAFMISVAQRLAKVMNTSIEEVAEVTSLNSAKVFELKGQAPKWP